MTLDTHKIIGSTQNKSILSGYKTLALLGLLSMYGDQPANSQPVSHSEKSIQIPDTILKSKTKPLDITNTLSQPNLSSGIHSLRNPYHPLVSNLFARGHDRKSLIDGLIANYQNIHTLINTYSGSFPLYPGDSSNTLPGAWAILESCLKANIVANPRSKTYNAAGLYQYIPDTRRTRFTKFKKAHPNIEIKNDRLDPRSNLLVTMFNLSQTQKNFDEKTDFALRSHHAGENRIKNYYQQYKNLTGHEPVSMIDWYNQIGSRLVELIGFIRNTILGLRKTPIEKNRICE